MKGRKYCKNHGGRQPVGKTRRVRHLPRLYKKYLSETLQVAVDSVMGDDPRESLNLFEELALMRLSAGNAIQMYSAAMGADREKLGADRVDGLQQMAAGIMSQALAGVQSMCESAAKIESGGKDKYSIHSLKMIVDQIVLVSFDVFKDHPELVREFERQIAANVRMPSSPDGTDIQPGDDVIEMDDTIPSE